MHLKNLLVFLVFLAKFHDYKGCDSPKKTANIPSPPGYSLGMATRVNLPKGLNDISGISYYPKDTSVFAIVDNEGILYKIHLHNNIFIQKWKFDKKHDFEDLVLHDSLFYLLLSDGNIETLKFDGKGFQKNKSIYPDTLNNSNDFESMYYDDRLKKMMIVCKKCTGETTSEVPAWEYSIETGAYEKSKFMLNITPLSKKLGDIEFKFKPSGIALNPLTNELFIISAVNKLLVIADRNGLAKDVFRLDPKIFRDPEGIAFTSSGDLIISNEAHGNESSNLLVIKHKTAN